MCAAVIPFSENTDAADFLPYFIPGYVDHQVSSDDEKRGNLMKEGLPTHIVRIVLRNNWPTGILPYVDGTDVFVTVDPSQTATFIWQEVWVQSAPEFHGGTIEDSVKWVNDMAEPFYIQYDDPFLISKQ